MGYVVTRWSCAFFCLWCSSLTFSQTPNTANKPPTLLDGTKWEGKIRLWYREADYHTSVITVRFRISKTGTLDTLQIDGGPAIEKDSIRSQLMRLNGKWKPQISKGKPVLSKWMCFRWYISGFYGSVTGCTKDVWEGVKASYDREESLYQCTSSWDKPYTCRTYFIEGTDYFWFPPMYSEIVH
jgi:hypothetical protein